MELVDEDIRGLVDAEWEARLGLPRSVLRGGGVHVVAADLGANDAMSFLLESTCIVAVPPEEIDAGGTRRRDRIHCGDAEAARRESCAD